MPITAPISRDERRPMQKAIHKTHDKNDARRPSAILMLHRGNHISDAARTLFRARSSVGHWINGFTQSGIEGLKSLLAGRAAAGRLSISAYCFPTTLPTRVPAEVQNCW